MNITHAFPPGLAAAPALVLAGISTPEQADGLLDCLLRAGMRLLCVEDGHQLLRSHMSLRPDLVLLDVRLPQVDGWQALSEIRRRGDTPVIMLGEREQDHQASVRLGANDYLAQPVRSLELMDRIARVLGRNTHAHVLRVGRLHIDLDAVEVTVQGDGMPHVLPLTLAEFKLLAHLGRRPWRVASRAELLEACLPDGDSLERSVDSHLSRLRKKLQRAGLAGMPVAVRGLGYKLHGA